MTSPRLDAAFTCTPCGTTVGRDHLTLVDLRTTTPRTSRYCSPTCARDDIELLVLAERDAQARVARQRTADVYSEFEDAHDARMRAGLQGWGKP